MLRQEFRHGLGRLRLAIRIEPNLVVLIGVPTWLPRSVDDNGLLSHLFDGISQLVEGKACVERDFTRLAGALNLGGQPPRCL
ncbi:hypothetical protein A5671_07570 [Mycolicibacter heraklionensis]|nr:hypothetical protein A5671_07570 [Mycolicibacter heraklionensis]